MINTHLLYPHNACSTIIRLREVHKILEYLQARRSACPSRCPPSQEHVLAMMCMAVWRRCCYAPALARAFGEPDLLSWRASGQMPECDRGHVTVSSDAQWHPFNLMLNQHKCGKHAAFCIITLRPGVYTCCVSCIPLMTVSIT